MLMSLSVFGITDIFIMMLKETPLDSHFQKSYHSKTALWDSLWDHIVSASFNNSSYISLLKTCP